MNEFQNQTPMYENTTFEQAPVAPEKKKLDTTKILIIALIAVLVIANIVTIIIAVGGKKGTGAAIKMTAEDVASSNNRYYMFGTEGLVPVAVEGKYGYMDSDGEMVIAPTFDEAYNFVNGIAKVGMENKEGETRYAIIDTNGDYVVDLGVYESIGSFSNGLAVVSKKVGDVIKYGYIDTDGEEAIECTLYDANEMTGDGYAYVITENKEHAVINTKGDVKLVLPENIDEFMDNEIVDLCATSDCANEAQEDSQYCYEHK